MDSLSGYARRPFSFVLRYLRKRLAAHVLIVTAVVAAVACSVGTQYGVKYLVDGLAAGPNHEGGVWLAFVMLVTLIAADNFLWRIASWTASFTFVGVTGDLRRDIFRHLTGHAPSYFSDRLPGMLTSRITATSNAVFTVENMFVWNVMPPCIATVAAIALIGTVSGPMAAGLIVVAGVMVVAMFHLAAVGKPLHDDFADKAAAVDGEMVDVINNMPLVRAFCGLGYEHDRFDATAYPRRGFCRFDHLAAGLGHRAVATRRRHHRRRSAGLHPGAFDPECHARSRGRAGRCHPACRAAVGGDRNASGSPRTA
jgi:ATP-binding cassette subfamily B protein